jgi:hypothetical protein
VASTYHLIRPIFGFWSERGQIIKLPANAVLRIIISKNGLGLCTAMWDERVVMVFSEDIQQNGISLEVMGDSAQSRTLLPTRVA